MSERNVWGDEYAIRTYYDSTPPIDLTTAGVGANTAAFNDATADADAFENDGSLGIKANTYGIALNNHPHMGVDVNVINQRKAIGVSYRRGDAGFEYQQGAYVPMTTWEFDVTDNIAAVFLWLLFQEGMTEGGASAYVKTYVPYAVGTEDVCVAAALLRKMSEDTANSHMFGGCICRSITFTANEGEPLRASAELVGYNAVTDFDFDADANIIEYDTAAPLLWQNAAVELDGTTINIPGFTLTITNNATHKMYDTQHVNKFILNDFTAEGSFQVPWAQGTEGGNEQLNNFINGTDTLLKIQWGTGSHNTDGDVEFEVNCRYTGATLAGDDEILVECPFEAVYDGSNNAIRCYVVDGINRLV